MLIESHRKGRYGKPGAEVRAVICKTCGLVYLNPQLDDVELNDLYSTNYAGTSLEAPDEKLVQMKETGVERILEWLEKRVNLADKAGKVLDVGCGMGSPVPILTWLPSATPLSIFPTLPKLLPESGACSKMAG